jgi:hypothetical protein
MAWTTPTIRSAGDAILASDQNIWVNDLIDLRAVLANTKQTHKTDQWQSALSLAYQDVTGLSVSITPTSNTSKILVMATVHTSSTINAGSLFLGQIKRGATTLPFQSAATQTGNTSWAILNFCYLDSPATTSATTYQFSIYNTNMATNYAYVNTRGDAGSTATSSITVREIPV